MFKALLDRLNKGSGLWLMAMSALGTITGLLAGGKLVGVEFVSAFTIWVTTVFGSAAVAGFRDWKKPLNGNGSGTEPKP